MVFLVAALSIVAHAQGQPEYPKLYPANVSAFDLENGMPISCAWDGLMDREGRLWINPCYKQAEHQTINFYQFNGRGSDVIHWDTVPAGADGQAVIAGLTESGSLYGFFRWTNHFFFFDPDNRQTHFYQLPPEDGKIFFMENSQTQGMILMAVARNQQFIYRMKGDSIQLLLEYPFSEYLSDANSLTHYESNYQVLVKDDLWFFEIPDLIGKDIFKPDDLKLNRFDLQTQTLKQYRFEDIFSGISFPKGYFENRVKLHAFKDKVILADCEYVFLFDPETEAIRGLDMLLPKKNYYPVSNEFRIETDAVGNVLFLQTTQYSNMVFLQTTEYPLVYMGILLDTAGRFFDYTPVLQAASAASRFPWMPNNKVWSRDFKRNIYTFHTGGVVAVDLKLYGSIRTFANNFPARGITEWTPGKYLMRFEGIDNFSILDPDSIPAMVGMKKSIQELGLKANPIEYTSIVKSADGFWWFSSGTDLVRMDAQQEYRYFPVGFQFDKFIFLDKKNLAIAGNNRLYRYNIDAREAQVWEDNSNSMQQLGVVNDLFLSKDSMLWIASLKGLWKVDLKRNTSTKLGLEDGFLDDRMMCIHQDEQGLLWIGTYGGGLHIYNPQSQAIKVIDENKGLSNNTVIGILSDADGDRWVSTYRGLNILSSKGEVRAQLFEEDGLTTNEFNRYSYYKDGRGRLFFGSIRGVNMLEPATIKRQLKGADNLKVYLTNITRYDAKREGDDIQRFGFDLQQPIRIPAVHRYLNIQFALSSLIRPHDQRFEYRIRTSGEDTPERWINLGNEPQLTLQNLPPGDFDVLIRGMDYRRNRAQQALVIPVHVERFFYQQFWFYALIFLTVVAIAAVWVIRQNSLRKALENELEERTTEIMSARDQMIAQEKLASLGQLVAGIAHEIKNPLNFINNFSEVNRDLLLELNEALEKYRSEPDLKKYQTIENIIKDIDDASVSIIDSGRRANQIVRSMMDHARGTQSERRPINLNELVDDNLNLAYHGFRALDPSLEVQLEKDLDPKMGAISVYPQELGRVLLNIFNNAFFAVNERRKTLGDSELYQPTIRVSTRRGTEEVTIKIFDNGTGVPDEIKEKVFMPFFTTKATGEGNTGLGLSISYDIITHRHQGQMTMESEAGSFTEFTICLPIK